MLDLVALNMKLKMFESPYHIMAFSNQVGPCTHAIVHTTRVNNFNVVGANTRERAKIEFTGTLDEMLEKAQNFLVEAERANF